ncbi:hypothetical protein BJ875DRAFT_466301 [Amylocarpus encephaloides]|uniref:Uncharacterized protein n=1 Tax=Amylocarpus encephaloides TaxID=45428 RepID=A0A9P8C523_9HELO|nr:hypothetical protein BJ875DRAFT_466301 [Amylocarpus encephaloides]
MPPWYCDFGGCDQPSVQRAGDCILCDRHLCRVHLRNQWLRCPKPDTRTHFPLMPIC